MIDSNETLEFVKQKYDEKSINKNSTGSSSELIEDIKIFSFKS